MIRLFSNLKLAQQFFILIATLPLLLIIFIIVYAFGYRTDPLTENQLIVVAGIVVFTGAYIATAFMILKKMTDGIGAIGRSIDDLSSGKFNGTVNTLRSGEIAAIARGVNILQDELKSKTEFAEQIQAGNLDAAYQPKEHDRLGRSLLSMRQNLLEVNSEDQKRKWTAEGLSKFVEVLRSNKDLKALSNDIIINLVKVLKANQGALFIVQEDQEGEAHLELQACYAYNRTKYLTRKVGIGEGLIGQVFLEKQTTHLKKVPDNYVRITSGLGDAPPKNVLIAPLKMDEEIVGIAELASFKEFAPHEIEFVQKIGESIAHTIISFRTAENTKRLLDESRARTEEMRNQEEELKQNQEELQATQEEISRKYDTLFAQLKELNHQSRFDQLKSITSTKKRNIEYYFDIIRNQIITFSEDKMIIEAVKSFRAAFRKIEEGISADRKQVMREDLKSYYEEDFIPKLNDNADHIESIDHYLPEGSVTCILQYFYIASNPHPTGKKSLLNDANDGSEYSQLHALYHPVIRSFLEKFGYYDIFLLDPETGDMVYSVFKEVDFATSLLTGLYHKTNFGRVVKEAIATSDPEFVRLIDFEQYDPSYRAPASFIACPVYDGDQKVGILVFQMPINKINQILTGDNKWREDGLGESGETIMAGSDYLLRSVSRDLLEDRDHYLSSLKKAGYDDNVLRQIRKANTSILLEKVNLDSVSQALRGITGTQIEKNDRGVTTLNSFAPLEIPDVQWIIMSTMKEEEASMRINDLRRREV